MKASQLTGMRVVDIEDARELGTVSDLMIDLERHIVTDLVLRGGVLSSGAKLVPIESLVSVGRDAITVRQSDITPEMGKAHAGAVALGRIQGVQIISEDGTRLGTVKDAELDPNGGRISRYVYAHGGFAGVFSQQESIDIEHVRRASRDMFVVSREAVPQPPETPATDEPQPEQPGEEQRIEVSRTE